MENAKLKLAKEWFLKAQDDELSAKDILEDRQGAASTVCFLCQQSAEKYLKGYLVFQAKNFPKIHQLDRLLKLCIEIDKDFSILKKEAAFLTNFYITTRYPGDYPHFTFRDAEKAFKMSVKIKNFILEKISE